MEEVEASEEEPTVRLLERVAVDKAHKVLRVLRPHRLVVAVNAPQESVWCHLFLPTEFLSQHLGMPVKDFKTICRFSRGPLIS